jgi:hypothetical protein
MTEGRGDGTTRAVAAFLVDRAHFLLPLALQLGEVPADFESTIRGSSMAPAIPAGSRLRVRLSGRESCQVGDVVFYLADSSVYTVHRVVYRARRASAEGHFLTEGDARFAPDPPVSPGQVLGTVVAMEVDGQWQPLGPQRARPWHQRVARFLTLTLMGGVVEFNVAAASRLAVVLLTLESRVRLARRWLVRLIRRVRFETGWGLSAVRNLLDPLRHPDVTYRKLDVARINELLPRTRRLEVARAISDSLAESDNLFYFRNVSRYNWSYRYLPSGIPLLDDLNPPNVAVLDFLAHRITNPELEVLLDFPCGIGALLVYERDLGLTQVHGFDNWAYLSSTTAKRFLERFGMAGSVLVTKDDLASLPLTILTCVGFPLTMIPSLWAKPSVKYVLADRLTRPMQLPGFQRTTEYAGLLTVFERVS